MKRSSEYLALLAALALLPLLTLTTSCGGSSGDFRTSGACDFPDVDTGGGCRQVKVLVLDDTGEPENSVFASLRDAGD